MSSRRGKPWGGRFGEATIAHVVDAESQRAGHVDVLTVAGDLALTLGGTLGYALGRTGFSGLVTASAATYRGLSEAVLDELGQSVFDKHLAGEIYPESRALVKAHQEMGHTLAIVSSATPYQVDPLARDLGIDDVLCTRLAVEDGVFTGQVVRPTCFGVGKLDAVREAAQLEDVDGLVAGLEGRP